MSKKMNGDTVAMLTILAAVVEALDVQQPGVRQAIAESLQAAVEHSERDSTRATLRAFGRVITKEKPPASLFH